MSASTLWPKSAGDNEPRPRRWSRDEYHRAAELGFFRPDERLELIDGEVIERMSPVGSPHSTAVRKVHFHLSEAFGDGHVVSEQQPITLSDSSEPEPDISVAAGAIDDFEDRHPEPVDIALIVEVSDSTLAFDRGRKAQIYVNAGIGEYWILDLNARRLEVLRSPDPSGEGFRLVRSFAEADSLSPLAAPHARIRVADLLPRKR